MATHKKGKKEKQSREDFSRWISMKIALKSLKSYINAINGSTMQVELRDAE